MKKFDPIGLYSNRFYITFKDGHKKTKRRVKRKLRAFANRVVPARYRHRIEYFFHEYTNLSGEIAFRYAGWKYDGSKYA